MAKDINRHFYYPLFLLVLITTSTPQTSETFDIATFVSPTGWNKVPNQGAMSFTTSNEAKGTFAFVTLYRSAKSSGSAKNDFETDWQQFVATKLGVKDEPRIEPAKKVDGWESITGVSTFKGEMGPAVVVLNTFSGYGRSFSAAAIFNSEEYLPSIESFAASIKLRKPTMAVPTVSSGDNSIVGTWGTNVVIRSTGATSYAGTAGSTIKQYTFNPDGTYSFASKTFKFSYDKLLLIKESGSYQVDGSVLTVDPQSSVAQAWSKKDGTDRWGKLLSTENQTLEKVTYNFTKNYSIVMDEWALVMQAPHVTQRDGSYNGGTAFANAWMYSPPCSKCLIELP